MGKHSGRNAFRTRLKELSYNLSDDELNRAFVRFKELADKKKDISTADLEALANDASQMITEDRYKMVTHSLNTPSQYILLSQHTLLTHPLNTLSQHTYPLNTPILSTHLIIPFFIRCASKCYAATNTLSQHILTHPPDTLSQYTYPLNTSYHTLLH